MDDSKAAVAAFETIVMAFVDDVLKVDTMEEAFNNYLVHRYESNNVEVKNFKNGIVKVFTGQQTEVVEAGIKCYVNSMAAQINCHHSSRLFDILEHGVTAGDIPARSVCECLLTCDKLTHTNRLFWIGSFELIKKIIGGVDYKGVCDIMKMTLDIANLFPITFNASLLPLLEALETLIEHIFDREACLLPGYFIMNEIQKTYPRNPCWPHWRLAGMMSRFADSFRETAQMVSVIGRSRLRPIVDLSGLAAQVVNTWKLEPATLRFSLKGNLPYDEDLIEPQTALFKYVLEQPYSRDVVCSMLGSQKQHKQRCPALEEQFVEMIVDAMKKSEAARCDEDSISSLSHWSHISSQLIFFVLFQFASFPHMVLTLYNKLSGQTFLKGRDHLMWVLLQFISGSIQKKTLNDFILVLKLYDLLYPERDPLPVPDVTKSTCTHKMAVTCIWIHLVKKAQVEQVRTHRPIPYTLKLHHEFLQHLVHSNGHQLQVGSDFTIALLCNAYSTNQEYFARPMGVLFESLHGPQKSQTPMPGSNLMTNGPTAPISMDILDSLTVHAKMSLIHSIVTHVVKMAQAKSNLALPPALLETYSRLLVYMEIESIGIKGFISQLLLTVFKSQAWGILHTLLEMFSYRLHHIKPHYRIQLLSQLHSLASVPQTNQTQLHLCVESTALRLITRLGSAEVQTQLSRLSEPKTLISSESEELNRALVLTLARAIHVTGSESLSGTWCKEILNTIMQNTPHSWPLHTLQFFPSVLTEFFQGCHVTKENRQQLKKAVEEEYRKWMSMNNESDIIAHFSQQGTPPLFICLLWKMIMETERIDSIAYKILERVGARPLSAHLRTFCDYFVSELSTSGDGQKINKCIDAVNDLIWKYHIITIDRLILTLVLRNHEGNEVHVCFLIIQFLIGKCPELQTRVVEFVKDNSPEYWKQSNWHDKHLAFHKKFPEKFAPEGILEQSNSLGQVYQTLPIYFGNVCLRFLPVFDILIHRYLEINPVIKILDLLLDNLGVLYKFHDRPVTYLYNTLHYYEKRLQDEPLLKKKLVGTILLSQKDVKPAGWALTEKYLKYLEKEGEDTSLWTPDLDYYIKLVERLVDTIAGDSIFPQTDWRFNEFPNPASHALHITCVELMALPVTPEVIANQLIDILVRGHSVLKKSSKRELECWTNALGSILTFLPDSYFQVINDRILSVLNSPLLTNYKAAIRPFQLFNFKLVNNFMFNVECAYLLAIVHASWCHASIGHISGILPFIRDKVKPVLRTEEQLIYIYHLVGPFLQRFHVERTKCLFELTVLLYELLEIVDQNCVVLNHVDPICDLLYHIKYMFIGNVVKSEAEKVIKKLRPALQNRLKCITYSSSDK